MKLDDFYGWKSESSQVGYDKKSDEGSNSVQMRHENSGASKVVKK